MDAACGGPKLGSAAELLIRDTNHQAIEGPRVDSSVGPWAPRMTSGPRGTRVPTSEAAAGAFLHPAPSRASPGGSANMHVRRVIEFWHPTGAAAVATCVARADCDSSRTAH